MGDIRRTRKKYQTPSHPWQMARLEEERPLLTAYGLDNKNELWKMHSIVRNIAAQAKSLIAKKEDKQSQKERELLMNRLIRFNLIRPGDPIETALGLTSKDILERRLQTLVYRKNLAKTIKQARQLITHQHIMVSKKAITSPSYIVSAEEESKIEYAENSPIADETHPERPEVRVMKQIEEEKEKIKESAKKEEKKEHEPKK